MGSRRILVSVKMCVFVRFAEMIFAFVALNRCSPAFYPMAYDLALHLSWFAALTAIWHADEVAVGLLDNGDCRVLESAQNGPTQMA